MRLMICGWHAGTGPSAGAGADPTLAVGHDLQGSSLLGICRDPRSPEQTQTSLFSTATLGNKRVSLGHSQAYPQDPDRLVPTVAAGPRAGLQRVWPKIQGSGRPGPGPRGAPVGIRPGFRGSVEGGAMSGGYERFELVLFPTRLSHFGLVVSADRPATGSNGRLAGSG